MVLLIKYAPIYLYFRKENEYPMNWQKDDASCSAKIKRDTVSYKYKKNWQISQQIWIDSEKWKRKQNWQVKRKHKNSYLKRFINEL